MGVSLYSHERRLHISIRAEMFAQRVAARQGTAAERVSLIGDDKAEPIARHAPARRGGLAAAVVARDTSEVYKDLIANRPVYSVPPSKCV